MDSRAVSALIFEWQGTVQRRQGVERELDPWLQAGENLLLSLDDDETLCQWQGVTIPRRNLARWLLGV